jgi:hypothetical protein
MADLGNVTRAFGWILAYYGDLAKIFLELQSKMVAAGFDVKTEGQMDTAQSKTLQRPALWLARYCYQFFTRPDDVQSLYAVLVVGHHADITEPYVTLARFKGGIVLEQHREITYWWDDDGASDDEDAWVDGDFKGATVRHRWFSLSRVATLEDVKLKMVDPLVDLANEKRASTTPTPISTPSADKS